MKRCISCSLFNAEKYKNTYLRIPDTMKKYLPDDLDLVIYYDFLPDYMKNNLMKYDFVKLIQMPRSNGRSGCFWRYLAYDNYDLCFFRDIDVSIEKNDRIILEDFLQRVADRNLNKKSMKALIKSGALDELGERSEMLENLEDILAYSKEITHGSNDQTSLFATSEIEAPKLKLREAAPISDEQRLTWEKELLGLYISGHPLERFKDKIKNGLPIATILSSLTNGMTTCVVGHIDDVKVIRTKKGDEMAFVKVSDLTDKIEIVVFPKIYAQNRDLFVADTCVAIKGQFSTRNGEASVLAEKVKKL